MTSSPGRVLLSLSLLCAAANARPMLFAQTSAAPDVAAQGPSSDASQTQKPSSLIAPAVDHLSQVVSQIQLERWKGNARDETDSNLRSVEHDVRDTLPGLVTTADAQPASVAASLPVLRNLDALCAVMIRVSVVARASAPTPQAEAITGALTALQSARNTLDDQVLALATAQEKQISSLTSTVATLTAKLNAPPPPPSSPSPATRATVRKKRKATVAKPPAPAASQPTAKPASQSPS